MDQLPTELWLHIGEYLDYRSLVNLSICSKHWYEATSLSYLWKRLFDIYFSVGWLPPNQELRWKSLFAKHLRFSNETPDKSIATSSIVVCVSEPRGHIVACGKVVQTTCDVAKFPKYKLQIFDIIENEQVALPTEKYIVCPRHLVDTLVNAPRRASTAFMFFAVQNRKSIIQDNPGLPRDAYRKIVAEKWTALPNAKKQEYQSMAKKDNEQCVKDNQMYRYITLIHKATSM